MLAFGFVGSEHVCTGRAVGASMLLLQSRKGSERVGQIVAEVARRRSQVGPGSVLLHEGLVIVCGAAAPAPGAAQEAGLEAAGVDIDMYLDNFIVVVRFRCVSLFIIYFNSKWEC